MSASKRLKLSSMAPSRQSTGAAIVRFYDPDVQAEDALGRTQEQILAWNNSQLENSHNYIQVLFPLPEGSPYNWSAPVIDLDTMKAFRAKSELRQRLRYSFERMLTFYGFTTSIYSEPESEDKDVKKQEQTPTGTTTIATAAQEGTQDAQAPPAATGGTTTTENSGEATTTETPSAKAGTSLPRPTSQVSPSDYYVVRGPNWHKASRSWCVRMDHNHLRITRILRCLRVLGLQTECDTFFAALKHAYDDPATSIGQRSMEFWTRAVQRPLYIAPDDDKCDWLRAWEEEQQRQN